MRNGFTELLPIVISAIILRSITNIDKILLFQFIDNYITSSYYFTAALSLSFIGVFESVVNNKLVPKLLREKITKRDFIKNYFTSLIFILISYSIISIIIWIFPVFERLDPVLFILFCLNYALVYFSNSFHFIVFRNKHDYINILSNLAPLFLIIIGFLLLDLYHILNDINLSILLLITALIQAILRYLSYLYSSIKLDKKKIL
jgi:hypothetical protein